MWVLDRSRWGASLAGGYPKGLKSRGRLRDIRIEEGVRRYGLRVHAPGAFFISASRVSGCVDVPGMKEPGAFAPGSFSGV
jgi:hypothetical protein